MTSGLGGDVELLVKRRCFSEQSFAHGALGKLLMCCSLRLASVSVEASMSVLLGINSSLFMQSIKLHPLKEVIWFIMVKCSIFCTVFNITVISFLSMVSVELMVPQLPVINSYFQCLYSLRGSSLRPHRTIAKVTELSVTQAPSMHGKNPKRLKNKKYQLTNSELEKHNRFHSPTLTNPISTYIENARSVNLQGHLIHHTPWSCWKIFDQEGYSIIFLFLENYTNGSCSSSTEKSEWWQVSEEEEMCDRHTSLL